MWKPYLNVAKSLFSNARIIIDKYHYARQVIWVIYGARKKVQKKLPKNHKKYFFNCRKILMSRKFNLDKTSLAKLDSMFWYDQELLQAYHLKKMFFECIDKTEP